MTPLQRATKDLLLPIRGPKEVSTEVILTLKLVAVPRTLVTPLGAAVIRETLTEPQLTLRSPPSALQGFILLKSPPIADVRIFTPIPVTHDPSYPDRMPPPRR